MHKDEVFLVGIDTVDFKFLKLVFRRGCDERSRHRGHLFVFLLSKLDLPDSLVENCIRLVGMYHSNNYISMPESFQMFVFLEKFLRQILLDFTFDLKNLLLQALCKRSCHLVGY